MRGRSLLIVLLFSLGLLLLVLPFYRPTDLPYLFLWVGRLHPLVLHFPIVLIILSLFFELGTRLKLVSIGSNVITITLLAAAATALVSISAGLFLFASGEYSGQLMDRHFWAGAITGAGICLAAGFQLISKRKPGYKPFYLFTLVGSSLAVGYTSHMGGSITHGEDYLTEYLPLILTAEAVDAVSPDEMLVYRDIITPILETKCISCHNNERAKGGLLTTSYQAILKGGESGKTSITAGVPEESELYARVTLPEGHSDRMPPEGKSPLSKEEIGLLRYWIENGAEEKLPLSEISKDTAVAPLVARLLPELTKYRRRQAVESLKLSELKKELEALAGNLFVTIQKDSAEEENLFAMRMRFPPAPFTNDQFRELAPYTDAFSKLSLVSSGIDDDGLYYLGQMKNLKKLYLQKTNIEGTGLVYLMKLPKLEVLNLSFTKIDDKAVLDLLQFPQLREVYLFGTNTSVEVVEAIRKNKPGLRVILEEGPYF